MSALLVGYGADLVLGDPQRRHPVAGFGVAAATLEQRAYAPSRLRGALVAGGLVAGTAALAEAAARVVGRGPVLVVVTWAALGGRSLRREALAIAERLEEGDLDGARERLPALCGRDPAGLDAPELSRAVVESLAENTSDAVVGALFWGAVAGPAGLAGYRAANTLDAMFGHRNARYEEFGWAAARFDDAVNWPAARCSAALTCLSAPLVGGSPATTLGTVRRDGGAHPSPNAGQVEAAFAGALGVRLGGPLAYSGRVEDRPVLGDPDAPRPAVADIRRAAHLSLAVCTLSALGAAGARAIMQRRRGR